MRINDSSAFHKENIFGLGQANTAYAQYFTGYSYLNPLTEGRQCPVSLANVTFEPGCRNHWHGAKKDSWFSHIAVEVPGVETSNQWLEPVDDETYDGLE